MVSRHVAGPGILAKHIVQVGCPTSPVTKDEDWRLFKPVIPDFITENETLIPMKWCCDQDNDQGEYGLNQCRGCIGLPHKILK